MVAPTEVGEVGSEAVPPVPRAETSGLDLGQVEHAVAGPRRHPGLSREVLVRADAPNVVRSTTARFEHGGRDVGPGRRLTGAGEVVRAERGLPPEQVRDAGGEVLGEGQPADLVVD